MNYFSKFVAIFMISVVGILASCGGNGGNEGAEKETQQKEKEGDDESVSNEVAKLKENTMKIHDEVMPKKDTIMRLKRRLENKLEEAKSGAQSEQMEKAIQALEQADEAMMDWMRNMSRFQRQADTMANARKMDFLEQEKQRIREVKRKMLKSMEYARKILKTDEAKKPEQ